MKRHIPAILLLIVLLSSCEKEITFIGQYEGPKLVMYSSANPDSFLSVRLYKSKFILDPSDRRLDAPVSGAHVTAEIGGTVYDLVEDAANAGSYVGSFKPREGDRIVLKAKAAGMAEVSSSTIVPFRPEVSIKSYSHKVFDTNFGGTREQVHLKLTVKDRPDERNYYRFRVYTVVTRRIGGEERYDHEEFIYSNDVLFYTVNSSGLGILDDLADVEGSRDADICVEDTVMDGKEYPFELFFDYYPFDPDERLYAYSDVSPAAYSDYMTEFRVEAQSLSESMYKYCCSLSDFHGSLASIGAMFGEPVSIYNNIEGGIGCFAAVSVSSDTIEMEY